MIRIFSFCCLLVTCSACAVSYLELQQVPIAIQNRLSQEYQGVKLLHWHKSNDQYIATFRRARYDYRYVFDSKATILQRSEEIRSSLLPDIIKDKVKSNYPSYALRKGVWLLQNEKDTMYIAEIQRGMKFYHLYFRTNGEFKQKEIILHEDRKILFDPAFLQNF
jgi:hypothetical protein